MNAASIDIKDLLIAESSLGLVFNVNLFVGRQPSSPRDCVTLYDTPGFKPGISLDGAVFEHPSVQILVRNQNYVDCANFINLITDWLQSRAQVLCNGTLYSSLIPAQSPFLLRWDDNSNAEFIVNLNLNRR